MRSSFYVLNEGYRSYIKFNELFIGIAKVDAVGRTHLVQREVEIQLQFAGTRGIDRRGQAYIILGVYY